MIYFTCLITYLLRDWCTNNVPNHFRTMTKDDAAIIQERRMSQQNQSKLKL